MPGGLYDLLRAARPALSVPDESATPAEMTADTPHLLLVDDERSIREPLAQYLTKQNFRVTQVADAEAARARLSAYAIDLVVLDIMMPGEDGLSLCRHIRATSVTPVFLLTA
jgi:two-component system OmpR family response regulator